MRSCPSWAIFTSALMLSACEARIANAPSDDDPLVVPDASDPTDASADPPTDARPIDAPAPLGAWAAATKVDPAATANDEEDDVTLTSDGLEMVFAIAEQDGKDLYYTSRASLTSPWRTPAQPLAILNTTDFSEETPRFSADDKTLYFSTDRQNGVLDIFTATRATTGPTSTFSLVGRLNAVSTTGNLEKWFMPCTGGRYVMIQSGPNAPGDLVEGVLNSGAAATPIQILNSTENEIAPFLTQDCLTIFFASDRSGNMMLYTSKRATVTTPWGSPTPSPFTINGGNGNQEDPWMSPDQRIFAFSSTASGAKDIYITTR